MTKNLHVALIMDGNRRYAKQKGLQAVKGHEFGAETLEKIGKTCPSLGISTVTLYAFSTKNFNRSPKEINHLMNLFQSFFSNKSVKEMRVKGTKFRFLGRLSMFPKDIQEQCKKLEEQTKNNTKLVAQFCFGYGGHEEIVDATKAIAQKIQKKTLKPQDITEKCIEKHLYSSLQPDFIIRTGGDIRTSDFLPWQTAYSEWFFIDKFWPELTSEDIQRCVEDFNNRQRRFGR